jgi:hypothetical protein
VDLHDNLGVSEVDSSQKDMAMVKTPPPDTYGFAVDCGIADIPPSDGTRMTSRAVAHQGIFENAFTNEWTASQPYPSTHTPIIDQEIKLCDFPSDSIMVTYIALQQWSTLEHVVSVGFDEVEEIFTVRDDGFTFEDTPMLIHLREFKSFLLYYKSKKCWGEGTTDDEVMNLTSKAFKTYCSSKAYHDDYATAYPTTSLKPLQRAGELKTCTC